MITLNGTSIVLLCPLLLPNTKCLHVSCRATAVCVLQIEAQQENNACLGYWLSNTVTLLYLLQKNIKPASGGTYTSRVRSPGSSR